MLDGWDAAVRARRAEQNKKDRKKRKNAKLHKVQRAERKYERQAMKLAKKRARVDGRREEAMGSHESSIYDFPGEGQQTRETSPSSEPSVAGDQDSPSPGYNDGNGEQESETGDTEIASPWVYAQLTQNYMAEPGSGTASGPIHTNTYHSLDMLTSGFVPSPSLHLNSPQIPAGSSSNPPPPDHDYSRPPVYPETWGLTNHSDQSTYGFGVANTAPAQRTRPLYGHAVMESSIYQRSGMAFPPDSNRQNEYERFRSSTEVVDLTGDSGDDEQGGVPLERRSS